MVLSFFTLGKNAPYCVNSIVKRVRKVNELNRQNPVSRGLAPLFFAFLFYSVIFDPLMETSQPGQDIFVPDIRRFADLHAVFLAK